ncbi:tetratricopeptide repeat protein [Labilibaculum sp.]|uniref:tetratricopeptide repeat protein n=1 Tax=Labilibaculum sp. TaxID=2060723 RepID=UPI00356786A2
MSQNKGLRKLFSKGKYDQAIELGQTMLSENPSDAELNSILGRSYTNSKQFQKAIPYLENSIASESATNEIKAISNAYLAKCYFVSGEEQRAVTLLQKIKNERVSKEASNYAQRYLSLFQKGIYYKAWEQIESENIRFHFQDKNTLKNPDEYMSNMERNYVRIVDWMGVKPGKKVDLFVWTDIDEAYRKFSRSLPFSNSELCTVNVLVGEPREYELVHMLCKLALQPKYKTMLISEGLGMYFNQMEESSMLKARSIVPKDKFSLLELWEKPTEYERNLSYPIGAAFIEFLINKGGKNKLQEFLKDQSSKHAEEVYPEFNKWVKTFEGMLMQ